jgi:hypothetical protein
MSLNTAASERGGRYRFSEKLGILAELLHFLNRGRSLSSAAIIRGFGLDSEGGGAMRLLQNKG